MTHPDLIPPPIRPDGLQVDERRRFQRRFWMAERWAWCCFGLIIAAALAGLTGSGGYFAHRTVQLAHGRLEAPRIARWETTDELTVTFSGAREAHRLVLHRPFSNYFEVEVVQPQPERALLTSDAHVLEFTPEGTPPRYVVLHLRPLRPGLSRYLLEVDGDLATLTTLILP